MASILRRAWWVGLLLCLAAPKLAAGLGAPGFSVNINFQRTNSPNVAGYLPDLGYAFGDRGNGYAYGWNVDNTANAFERTTYPADQRLETGNQLQPAGQARSWQIAVPNGCYDVCVVAADPADQGGQGTRYNLNVEGTRAIVDGVPSSTLWVFGTNSHIQVWVADRRLTVSTGLNATNNRVCFIEIKQVAPIFWGALVADNPKDWPYYSKSPADYLSESKPGVLGYFESHTGKKISMLLYGLGGFGLVYTNTAGAAGMWARGTIPFWDTDIGSSQNLSNVVEGYCDSSITTLAKRFKNYGQPIFMCFCREMNGTWYSWSETNSASSGAYQKNPTRYSFTNMWVYVHDKFTSLGATNVTWVWAVDHWVINAWHQNCSMAHLYPGDAYVDWVGIDAYNKGTSSGAWFTNLYYSTYTNLVANFPNKPILIKEIGTDPTEAGTPKPAWIGDFLHQLPSAFPNIRAFTWFDWNANSTNHDSNWPIEGGDNWIAYTNNPPIDWASVAAFSNGIASPFYLSNLFVNQQDITRAPSAGSTTPTIQPILLLPAPANVSATGTNGEVLVTWGGVVGATNYNIYRSTTPALGTFGWLAATTGTSYTDLSAVGGSHYYYTVAAQNLAGESVDSAPASNAPPPSLGLWLQFDESAGATAPDSSGCGNHGTLSGGTVWRPAGGIRAGALQFNGNNTQVVVPDAGALDNTPAFTLAYWFWSAGMVVDSGGLVSKRDGQDLNEAFATYLKRTDQHVYVDINGSASRFASQAVINNGTWYHVAVVFDGTWPQAQRSQLWINGQLDTVAPQSSSVLSNFSSSICIGNTQVGAANWFNGLIDDVRFYRRAVSPDEVAALAAVSLAPTNLTLAIRGHSLSLSWPADHRGWQLQAQTNHIGVGLSTNWFTVSGSSATNGVLLNLDPAQGSSFYRLFYPGQLSQ